MMMPALPLASCPERDPAVWTGLPGKPSGLNPTFPLPPGQFQTAAGLGQDWTPGWQ